MQIDSKAIRFTELKKIVPVSRSTIFRWEKLNIFPHHFQIGKNSVAWLLSDIEKWILERAKEGKK